MAIVLDSLEKGGAQRQALGVAQDLRRHGWDVFVVSLDSDAGSWTKELDGTTLPLHSIRRRRAFEFTRVRRLAEILRRERPDVVHSFVRNANAYAWLAAAWSGAGSFIASNRNAGLPRDRLRGMIDGFVYRRATRVVTNAAAVRDETILRFGAPAETTVVIPNRLDPSFFDLRRDDPPRWDVGSMGTRSPKKNLLLLCQLALRLPERRFVHVGAGDPPDCPGSERIEWIDPLADPRDLYAAIRVFVLPSAAEGTPNVLLEAMAAALPVVATRVGGIPELVSDGDDGFLADPGDAAGLANGLTCLLENPQESERIGRNAREHVKKHHGAEDVRRAFESLYNEVAAVR